MTRQTIVWIGDDGHARSFVHRLIGFVHALRHQLRGTDSLPELTPLVDSDLLASLRSAHSRPSLILQSLGRTLGEAVKRGDLHPQLASTMEAAMVELTDVLGGCERIANTPIPFAYSVIVHRTVYIYCFLLPFGLISNIGILTPLMVTFVAYTFLALDALNEELEEPFGAMPNDLPLTALSTGIEITLRELLGESPLPAVTIARDFILP